MSSGERQDDDLERAGQWDACPAGELTQLVQRLDASQRWARRKQVYRTGLLSTGLFACVVFAVGSLMGPDRALYGGISCATCRSHFEPYRSHITGQPLSDDADFVSNMATHLEKCTFCREKFNSLYPDHRVAGAARSARFAAHTRALIAWQPMFAMPPQASF